MKRYGPEESVIIRKEIIDRCHAYCLLYFIEHFKAVPLRLLSMRHGRQARCIGLNIEALLRTDDRFSLDLNPKTNGIIVSLNDFYSGETYEKARARADMKMKINPELYNEDID